MRRLRTVIVGFGKIGASYADDPVMARHYPYATHAQVLAEHPAFDWDACVDPSVEALALARNRWGIQLTATSLNILPADYAPDVVVIATPPATRAAIVHAFPSARAFLVEKPLGHSVAEGEQLLQQCKQQGALLQVALWRRADLGLRALMQGQLNKFIGAIQGITGIYGNGLRNNGVHMIDFVRMLAGEVAQARALSGWRASCGPLQGDTDIPFHLTMTSGVPVSFIPVDFRAYRENSVEIWGECGRISIMQEGLVGRLFRKAHNRAMQGESELNSDLGEPVTTAPGRAFYELYDNLAQSLEGRTTLLSSGESALRSEVVLAAVWQSMERGGALVALREARHG